MTYECYARTTRYLLPCSDTHFSGRGAGTGAFANYENLCFFLPRTYTLSTIFLFRVSVRVLGGSHEGWFWTLTSGILESHFQRRLGRKGRRFVYDFLCLVGGRRSNDNDQLLCLDGHHFPCAFRSHISGVFFVSFFVSILLISIWLGVVAASKWANEKFQEVGCLFFSCVSLDGRPLYIPWLFFSTSTSSI